MFKTSGGSIATTGSGLTTLLDISAVTGAGTLSIWSQDTASGAGSVYFGTQKLCDLAAGAFSLQSVSVGGGGIVCIKRSGTTNMSGWNAIWCDVA